MTSETKPEVVAAHRELVANLIKPGQKIIDDLTPEAAHNLHMAVGFAGEVGELSSAFLFPLSDACPDFDYANFVEELGDAAFFLEGLRAANTPDLDFPDDFELFVDFGPNPRVQKQSFELEGYARILALAACAGRLLDIVKRQALYAKPLNIGALTKELVIAHSLLRSVFDRVVSEATFNWDTDTLPLLWHGVLQGNIDKLNKRYASGSYSNAAANARADKTGEDQE